MKSLVFSTNNQHKLQEVQALVGDKFQLKTLKEIGCLDEIPETGTTFEANASQKSHYVFDRFRISCFSDDSGLEIDGLNGEPGVYSAHYSGSRDAEENLQLVLKNMEGVANRAARFRCVISLILDGNEHLFEGSIEGEIALQKSGIAGFGYDPIFKPAGYNRTFSEMSAAEKNAISHRGIAIQKMVNFLKESN